MPWTAKVTRPGRGCPAALAAASTCGSAPASDFAPAPLPADPVTLPARGDRGRLLLGPCSPARPGAAPARVPAHGRSCCPGAVRDERGDPWQCSPRRDPRAAPGWAGISSWHRRGRNPSPHLARGDSCSPSAPS